MRLYFDEKDNFIYTYILWFSVSPKRVGLGSKIINEIKIIIDEIRKGNLFPKSNINPASKEPVTCPTAFEELKIPMSEP